MTRLPTAGPIAWFCLALLLVGCGPGAKFRVRDLAPRLEANGEGNLPVAVHDQRQYVRSDEKPRSYLGSVRKAGIPYDVVTDSGRPLADELADVLVAALKSRGFAARAIPVQPHFTELDAVKTLVAAGADRSLLLAIGEWYSDTRGEQSDLHFDLRLEVLNRYRSVEAQARVQGDEQLTGPAAKVVPAALRSKLEALLNQAEIRAALAASPSQSAAPAGETP